MKWYHVTFAGSFFAERNLLDLSNSWGETLSIFDIYFLGKLNDIITWVKIPIFADGKVLILMKCT